MGRISSSFIALGVSSGALLCASGSAQAVFLKTIDQFSSGGYTLQVDYTAPPISTSASLSQAGLTEVIGGRRDSMLQYVGFPPPDVDPTDRSRMRVATVTSSLSLSTDSGILVWAFLSYGLTADLNEDLGAGGATGIRMDFIRNDQAFPVTIKMYSEKGTGTASSESLTLNAPASNATFLLYFDFAAFVLNSGPGFNLADVDRIDVTFTPQVGGDFTLDAIGTVPTPGSMALVVVGGVLAMRRRR